MKTNIVTQVVADYKQGYVPAIVAVWAVSAGSLFPIWASHWFVACIGSILLTEVPHIAWLSIRNAQSCTDKEGVRWIPASAEGVFSVISTIGTLFTFALCWIFMIQFAKLL
jgi:hypothetical protein